MDKQHCFSVKFAIFNSILFTKHKCTNYIFKTLCRYAWL